MNLASFLVAFPEFASTDPVLVQAKLTMAAARMGGPDQTVWGGFTPAADSIADQAHGLLAAHFLITSPFGTATLMATYKPGTKTSYYEAYEEIEQAMAHGFVTAGGP